MTRPKTRAAAPLNRTAGRQGFTHEELWELAARLDYLENRPEGVATIRAILADYRPGQPAPRTTARLLRYVFDRLRAETEPGPALSDAMGGRMSLQ